MSKRSSMLASEVRALIAPFLRECPPECGIVSITAVEVSPDVSYATVHISALQDPERALQFLEGRRHELQGRLSDLHRKKIPLLRFRIDRSGEHVQHIEKLLG